MVSNRKLRHRILGAAGLLAALLALGPAASSGIAAGPPSIGEVWAASVFSTSAHLESMISPNGESTTFHIDYIPDQGYQDNLDASQPPFTGGSRIPASVEAVAGIGTQPVKTAQILASLTPDTTYRYRVTAQNTTGPAVSAVHAFRTQAFGTAAVLPDGRGWEMVSPVDKNGGQVEAPGALAGGGALQAAADGQSVTYGSAASFGEGAIGAATASQYLARRGDAGWSTQNITAPLYSGSYGTGDEGVPYQLFSGDLSRALLLNGRHCRGEAGGCAVPNPPLPGTDAPVGYQNYYLRDSGAGGFQALLGAGVDAFLGLDPSDFELSLAGASTDLGHTVLSTCAALTVNAVEVPLGSGCDPAEQNLYLWSPGSGLTLVNVPPAATQGKPGAALGAQSAAVSNDGSRVYWNDLATGDLYVRSGGGTKLVAADADFETAAANGALVYYSTAAGHLERYDADADSSTDLTPGGGLEGVLGASADGASVYYLTSSGLFLSKGGTTTEVAADADASNYPATTGTARVSADGDRLLFMSTEPLTEYDNTDLETGAADSQVYLYKADGGELTCVSCNPTLGRPVGPSSIPGATANGSVSGSTRAYKPRALSANGNRVYFESGDAIGLADTNGEPDVYQWEAQGSGDCARPEGCVALISSGRSEEPTTFVDASAGGSDVFFLTHRSLVDSDLAGSVDLYDARVGGGFPEPPPPLACDGDACQSLPPVPVDPTLTTRLSGPGNPPVSYPKQRTHCKGGFVKRKGKCVKVKRKKKSSHKKRAGHHRRHGR